MLNPGPECTTIVVSSSTTHAAQLNLLGELFDTYGPSKVFQKPDGQYSFYCYLNTTFAFLLDRQDCIPPWILEAFYASGNAQPFLCCLAGYTDAEGNFYTSPDGKSARFRVGSYEVGLLQQVHEALGRLGVLGPPVRVDKPKGTPIKGTPYVTRGDYWRLEVNRKTSLNRLCELLEAYLRHAEKRRGLYAVWANVIVRGV